MKNIQQQRKDSGKVQIGLLVAVVLAAGSAGVWSELKAAQDNASPQVVSRSITAASPDWSTFADINENGNGTAFTALFVPIGDHEFSGSIDFATPIYDVSTNVRPGQSGGGAGSGTGGFSREVWVVDVNTWELTRISMATVELSVVNAATVGAFVRQGVTTQGDPLTGETRIVREHVIGNEATGDAAGSVSVWLDGELVAQSTGGFGLVRANTTHTVQQIH